MLQTLEHTTCSGGLDFQVYVIFLISSSNAGVPSINLNENEVDICLFE